MNNHQRWNIEETANGFRVCYGNHERSAGCEWVEFVPSEPIYPLARIVATEWSAMLKSGTIFETTPVLRDSLSRLSGEFRQ